jgi:hypothetical protein
MEDNIKKCFREMECEAVDLCRLTRDRVYRPLYTR